MLIPYVAIISFLINNEKKKLLTQLLLLIIIVINVCSFGLFLPKTEYHHKICHADCTRPGLIHKDTMQEVGELIVNKDFQDHDILMHALLRDRLTVYSQFSQFKNRKNLEVMTLSNKILSLRFGDEAQILTPEEMNDKLKSKKVLLISLSEKEHEKTVKYLIMARNYKKKSSEVIRPNWIYQEFEMTNQTNQK